MKKITAILVSLLVSVSLFAAVSPKTEKATATETKTVETASTNKTVKKEVVKKTTKKVNKKKVTESTNK